MIFVSSSFLRSIHTNLIHTYIIFAHLTVTEVYYKDFVSDESLKPQIKMKVGLCRSERNQVPLKVGLCVN